MPRFYVSKRIGGIIEATDDMDAEDKFAQYANEATDDEFEVKVREIQPWENLDEDDLYLYWVDLTSPEIMAPNREAAIKLAVGMLTTGELHKDIRLVNVEETE